MASSPIPTLSDILYYTPSDSYDFLTDNRPIHQLDTNIRSVATSLVGIGYGEHTSIDGRLLTPGKVVELVEETGKIKYPHITQGESYTTAPRLGLVIGSSSAGLNRVIWGSPLLDLEALGLTSCLPSSAIKGVWLAVDPTVDETALLNIVVDNNQSSVANLRFGRVESRGYISINPLLVPAQQQDPVAEQNHSNLYGFTKNRNLLLSIDLGEVPIQYTKNTIRYRDVAAERLGNVFNSMSAQLAGGKIDYAGSDATTVVGAENKIIKETYTKYFDAFGNDVVKSNFGTPSPWVDLSYKNDFYNYELQPLAASGPGSIDYSSAQNLDLFKNFKIEKYFQYHKSTNTGDPLLGKVMVTATVFRSPDPVASPGFGGEPTTIIIWDFYHYNGISALEDSKSRVITMGTSAEDLFNTEEIFPSVLRAL